MVLWNIRDNRPPYLDLVKLSSLNFTPVESARKSQPPVMHMTLLLSTPRALSVSWPGRKLRLCVQAVSAQWFRRGRWLIHAFPDQTMRHTRYHQQTAGLNMPSPSFVRVQWFRKYRLFIHAFRKREYIYMLPPTCHRLYLSVRYDLEEVNCLIMHSWRRRRYKHVTTHMPSASFDNALRLHIHAFCRRQYIHVTANRQRTWICHRFHLHLVQSWMLGYCFCNVLFPVRWPGFCARQRTGSVCGVWFLERSHFGRGK